MKWFRLILAAALSLTGIGLWGTPDGDLRFVHYNRADGSLPYDGIRVMMQDSRHIVWIGTHKGLSMYDGVHFKNYYREDFKVDSDYICSLHEDMWGNLWIGTDSGVVLRTPEDGKFHPMAEIFGTSVEDRVFSIVSAPDSSVWFGTRSSGLYRCRPDRKEFRRIYLQDESGEEVKNFYRLSCADDGTVLAVVYCSNVYTVVPEDSRLVPIDTGNDADFFINDDIEGLVHGSGGEIYVASKKRGLCRVAPGGDVKVLLPPSEGHRPVNLEMCGTELFLSTTEGLFIYDTASAEIRFLHSEHEDPFSIADNYVCSAFRDSVGAIWVGTLGAGVNHSSPAHGLFSKYGRTDDGLSLAGCNVSGFAQDSRGGVWIATEQSGLLHLSRDGQLRQFRSGNLPQNMTAAIGVPPYVWIGAQNGIYRLSPRSGRIVAYPLSDSPELLPDNRIVSFYCTRNNTLYTGTSLGVLRYDSASDSFQPVPELDGLTIEGMAEDSEGRIWMASYSDGVYVYDPKDSVLEHYSSRSSAIPEMISSLCVDAGGRVWVASFSSGIFVKDEAEHEFRRISKEDLPSLPTDMFFSVIPDNDGNLYLSSDDGLVRYCPETSRVKLFRVPDGLLENQFRKPSIMLSDGSIMLGSANGFISFDPSSVKDIAAPVVISDSSTDNRQLHFSFAVPSIPLSQSGGVYCMLEGYEQDWRDVSTGMEVTYSGVPAGNYHLRIGSMDAGGTIFESEGMYISVLRRNVFIWLPACVLAVLLVFALLYFRFNVFRKAGRKAPVENMDISSLSINDYDNDFIQRLEKVMMENIQNPDFSPRNLEEQLFISHSTLNRKMKSLLDMTPGDYIRKKRLSIAAQLLSSGSIRVSEIVRAVGFSSASYFTKCFKAEYGVLPVEYRERNSSAQ